MKLYEDTDGVSWQRVSDRPLNPRDAADTASASIRYVEPICAECNYDYRMLKGLTPQD